MSKVSIKEVFWSERRNYKSFFWQFNDKKSFKHSYKYANSNEILSALIKTIESFYGIYNERFIKE